jgi:hypothetical protein
MQSFKDLFCLSVAVARSASALSVKIEAKSWQKASLSASEAIAACGRWLELEIRYPGIWVCYKRVKGMEELGTLNKLAFVLRFES